MNVALRPAGAGDGPMLAEMLAAAAFWRPGGHTGSVAHVPPTASPVVQEVEQVIEPAARSAAAQR